MSNDVSTPPEVVRPDVPWWLGRGMGMALLTLVVGVGWATWWTVAAQVESSATTAVRWWPDGTANVSPVAAAARPPVPERDRTASAAVGTPDLAQPPSTDHEAASTYDDDDDDAASTDASLTDHALQDEVLAERQRARERRALRADQELADFIESVGVLDELDAWVPPISAAYRISATFGQAGSLWSADHTGVDLAAPTGTPVSSVAAGTVSEAGDAGAYGSRVEVTHGDGSITSYSHLSRIDVVVGQTVQQGAVIGAVGSTGNSTGPHLHLELVPAGGSPIDPVHALLARGVVL